MMDRLQIATNSASENKPAEQVIMPVKSVLYQAFPHGDGRHRATRVQIGCNQADDFPHDPGTISTPPPGRPLFRPARVPNPDQAPTSSTPNIDIRIF